MILELPFAALNLKRNPFGELSQTERARLAITNIAEFSAKLSQTGFALQVLGEQGRGKTTHLIALKQDFPDAPYIYYAEDAPKPHVPKAPLLFLDETQRFSKQERKQIFKQNASFVIATHENHEAELKKAGLECVTLTLSGLSKEKLECILSARIEASRRNRGDLPYFSQESIQKLIIMFEDDLRSMFDYLYDIFQSLEKPTEIKL